MPQHLAQLAPRNEALARAKAREEFLAKSQPGFLSRLFGGADDPRLSGEQNRAGRQQAVLQGGFAGLMAAGKGANLITTVGTIGKEASDFREAHNEQIGEANLDLSPALDLQSQITEVVKNGELRRVLVNKRTGTEIADLGPSKLPDPSKDFGTPIKVLLPSGDEAFAVLDKNTGKLFHVGTGDELKGAVPVPPKPRILTGSRVDLETGIKYGFLQDEQGQIIPGSERVTGQLDDGDDEASAVDRRFARSIHRDVDTMDRLLKANGEGEYKAFGAIETAAAQAGSGGGLLALPGVAVKRVLSGSEVQIFNAAAQNVLSNIIKSRSGAQASNQEVERLRQFATPLPGDTSETVGFKLGMLRAIANDLEFGRDPFERVRDPSQPDGLRQLPFEEVDGANQMKKPGVTAPTEDEFSHLKRG